MGWDNTGTSPITANFTITTSVAPSLSISSPSDNSVYPATTDEVSISLFVENFTLSGEVGDTEVSDGTGDGYILGTLMKDGNLDGTKNVFSTSDVIDGIDPGSTYVLTVELVDNSGASLNPKVESTSTFSIAYPCDIELGTITTACNTETTSTDTYEISIPFTGGNTSTYTLTTDSGVIGGDNPSTSESGVITISNVAEATNVVFTLKGDSANSTCDLLRNVNSPTCLPAPTCPAIGSLIVTEVMQNPNKVGDGEGEYFEIYNTTGSPIDMQGWMIKSLTNSSKDHTISSSLIVPANGYVVLGINSNSATNGGVTVNYQYGSNFYLGNSSDSIVLECGSAVIDSVSWDNGATFPDPNGKSMELAIGKYNATDNDSGTNWGEATSDLGNGDFGTPGAANSFVLSVRKNSIEGFATYPNPITNKRFTISSSNAEVKEISVFNVLGKKVFSTSFTGLKKDIDVSAITSGVYILKVTEAGKTATKKLVVR